MGTTKTYINSCDNIIIIDGKKTQNYKTKTVKLIYDRYENEFGVSYFQNNEIIIDKTTILDNLPMKINDTNINFDRILTIYSWGIKKDKKIC